MNRKEEKMSYKCKICGYVYDEQKEGKLFCDLPDDWRCPICSVPKSMFDAVEETPKQKTENSVEPKKTSSDVIAETLSGCGLKWVFGMVGHSNLAMAEAIRKSSEQGKINFLTMRHEGAASFAASAYGKLVRRPAAVLTIAGPGATNLLTGLYDAKLDNSPVIALTGQVPSKDIGYNIFQEVDLNACFSDVAVCQHTMFDGADFSKMASDAYRNSVQKKGVSQIIMPDDVQALSVHDYKISACNIAEVEIQPNSEVLQDAVSLIKRSKRVVIVVGDGARGCDLQIKKLAEILKCAVVTTYRAKGFIEDSFPNACGVVGRSGTQVSAHFINSADLLISFGVGFSRHSAIDTSRNVIQVDVSPNALGRFFKPTVAMHSTCSFALDALIDALSEGGFTCEDLTSEIQVQKNLWKEEKQRRAKQNSEGAISPAFVCEKLSDAIPSDAIVSVDVGNVAYSFGRYFEAKNQRFLLSWYLGSIGCGLPSAIGAACATKQAGEFNSRKVVAIVGDGGLGQYLADFSTLVKYNLNVCVVVFNNSELAKISAEQASVGFNKWETSLTNPNFAEFARSCGAEGVRVSSADELEIQLKQVMAMSRPSLIEVMTNSSAT